MPNAQGQPTPGDPDYIQPAGGDVSGGGLISQSGGFGVPVTGYTPAQATATLPVAQGYAPEAYVTPKNASVAEQVLKITGQDSPLMQKARADALQNVNARGLINSSIAVGEGQKAVIAQSLPIAQQDAAQEYQSMRSSTDAINAARAFEAHSRNTASIAGAELTTKTALANAESVNRSLEQFATAKNTTDLQTFLADLQAQTQRYLQELSSSTQLQVANIQSSTAIQTANINSATQQAVAQLNSQTQLQLGQLDADNRQLLQTNINAASMFNQVTNNIAAIQQNPNLDETAKANAIQSQINMLNEALRTSQHVSGTPQNAIGQLNLGQFFSGNAFSPTIDPNTPVAGTSAAQSAASNQTIQSTSGTSITLASGTQVPGSMTKGQADQMRLTLQREVDQRRSQIPIWDNWDWRYASGVLDGGARESERLRDWFLLNEPIYRQNATLAQQSLDDFNRLYPA